MAIVTRQHVDNLAVDNSKTEITPEGFLKAYAPIARTGVYNYMQPDGTVFRELVTEDVLASSQNLDTLKLKPVTNSHPNDFVTVQDAYYRTIGTVGENFDMVNGKLYASFVVHDADGINAVRKGRTQLSPGYKCDVEIVSGTWNGQEYDGIQRSRIYNHLAIVDSARGGDELKIKVDSADVIIKKEGVMPNENTTKVNLDGATYEIPVQVKTALDRADSDMKREQSRADSLQKALDTVTAEKDMIVAKLEKLEKVDHSDEIAKAVKARVELITFAKDHIDSLDETKSDDDIKVEIIKKVNVNFDAKGKSADYITACYDMAVTSLKDSNMGRQREQLNNDGTQDKKDSRSERIEKLNSRWAGK